MPAHDQVWFQTDEAWDLLPDAARDGLIPCDVREEARGLRFITSAAKIDRFARRHAGSFRPFTLFGSGDFHHLSAVWLRQFTEPFTLLAFDNHPDWDIRPPRWSCGAWINRALETRHLQSANIWGCDNFECNFPGRLLGNRTAATEGRLQVHPWAQPRRSYPAWLHPITPETWRSQFTGWLDRVTAQKIYVTIDLDCLAADFIATNWEQGRFTPDELVWALEQVRARAEIIGGDLCGPWSQPTYGSAFQKLAGWFDHPKIPVSAARERSAQGARIFDQIWPILTGTKVR